MELCSAILPILRIAWNHSLSNRALADIDTLSVGTGAGVWAWSEETRCPGILTKTGETLAYARKTHVREMYERSTSVYESLREKKFKYAATFI